MIRQAIRRLVAGSDPWPLVLTGQPGTGKTCACLCVLDYTGGLYFTTSSLCEACIQAMKGQLLSPQNGAPISLSMLWEEVSETALLVLDELGSRSQVSDHHYECVKRAIDSREGRPLICASNLSLPELLGIYDDRIVSRLAAGTVVPLHGPDRRLEK